MGLINPKPRFAWDDATDLIYDYVAQRDVALQVSYHAPDGVWDLVEVKRLILAGKSVEAAFMGAADPEVPAPAPAGKKGRSTAPPANPVDPAAPDGKAAAAPKFDAASIGLSVSQLIALKLSPIQAAALKLTAAQMTATGVPAETVRAWAMTAERADALKLTAAQRKVLLP